MSYRRTKGIVTDNSGSDARKEADVIMTAAVLGLAADYIAKEKKPIQFDMDPLDAASTKQTDVNKTKLFNETVPKVNAAVGAYLLKHGLGQGTVLPGTSPGWHEGAMIVGVYHLAGQQTPGRTPMNGVMNAPLTAPVISGAGKTLWSAIKTPASTLQQYTGRGAYTGFVDDPTGKHAPVGPRSTVRMVAPAPGVPAPTVVPHPRWLPPVDSGLWTPRKRKGANTLVSWGLIGGDKAAADPEGSNPHHATNSADQIEIEMRDTYGMTFTGDVTNDEIATYTHGMIQAIYKSYALGPSCVPYEIAVGDQTKKMASCLPCTLFMHAAGYPPTSIHLGSGESWGPLFTPWNPDGKVEANELAVVRDLNNSWYAKCLEWLKLGLTVLDDSRVTADHKASRDAVQQYLNAHATDATVGGVLILDALTVHDTEISRLGRTLQ